MDIHEIESYHDRLHNEFERLRAEPCMKTPKIGDTVVVASGLINRGHLWVRKEAKVLAVSDAAVRVKFAADWAGDNYDPEWISPILIVDVLTPEAVAEQGVGDG